MKNALLLFSSLLITLSCKTVKNESMLVVKDCTGTYLRFNEQDFLVCNIETLESFANETEVTATFAKIDECKSISKDAITCMMYHENEGWIRVKKIK